QWDPAPPRAGEDPVVAGVDERDAGFGGEPVEHLYAARGHDGGTTFDPAVRVDAGAPDPLAAHLDNKWGPTLAAARSTVYAAWADFRRYNWDIFLARSDDGGATWGANARVDDFPFTTRFDGGATFAPAERVDDTGAGPSEQSRPSLALAPRGTRRLCYVAWEDDRNGTGDIYLARRACGRP